MNVLLATGSEPINTAVKSLEYCIVDEIFERSLLRKACEDYNPSILLISENLAGKDHVLIEEILYIKSHHPRIRIIYLAGNVDIKNKEKVNRLASLVFAGIYDIYCEKKISKEILRNLLNNPKKFEDVEYLTKYLRKETLFNDSFVEIDNSSDEIQNTEKYGYKNVILLNSIKPGSGKTFIAVNIATGLATFASKSDGSPLKVLIIDADLQNLSIGTLLDIEDNKYNLKTLSNKISQILDNEGNLNGSAEKIIEVNDFIKRSCIQSKYIDNLWGIVGSQLTIEDAKKINPFMFLYIIDVLATEYDYIIIDSNSSFFHTTTYPMLRISGHIFYVMNLDYNNIRNNQRCKKDLYDLEVENKIKYILNEDIPSDLMQGTEELIFNSLYIEKKLGYKFISKIPVIDKTVFLNRVFRAIPIIVDDKDYTLLARIELLKIVNCIHPIDNTLKKLKDELNSLTNLKRK